MRAVTNILKQLNFWMENAMNIGKSKTKKTSEIIDISSQKFQNYVEITLLFALAGIPLIFVPLRDNSDYFYLPKVLAMIVLVLAFLIIYILSIRKISSKINTDWINKTLAIFLLLRIISLFFAENIESAIYGSPGRVEGLITIVIYICLFLIARSFANLNDKFLLIIMGTAMIIALYGISQYFGIDPFPRDELRYYWFKRSFSTMGNPNFLGLYIVLMIPVSIYLFVVKKQKIGVLFYGVFLYCLLSTNTRGTWVGAMAAILCFVGIHFNIYRFKKEEFKRYVFLFVISLLIIVAINLQTKGLSFSRFASIASEGSNLVTGNKHYYYSGSNRGYIWKRVTELIVQRPLFGYGIENLGIAFEKYYREETIAVWGNLVNIDRAHNEYLHIAVTSGIPSLIAYLSFVVLVIRKAWLRLRLHENKHMLLLISCILGYLVAANFNISVVSVAPIFWMFLGFLAGSENLVDKEISR